MSDYERLLLEAIAAKLDINLESIKAKADELEAEHKAELLRFYGMEETFETVHAVRLERYVG